MSYSEYQRRLNHLQMLRREVALLNRKIAALEKELSKGYYAN